MAGRTITSQFCVTTVIDGKDGKDGERGRDGTSPYFADIDNEMVSVACDYNGNATALFEKTINVRMWLGSQQQQLTKLTTSSVTNITVTPDRSAGTIFIRVYQDSNIAQVSDVTVTIACNGSGDQTLHLYINGVRPGSPGEKAVVFDLVPSTSAIKRNKDKTLTPASPMTCNVLKKVGNAAATNATSSDGTLRYRVDGDITSSSDGTALTIGTGTVSYSSSNSYIVFAFFVGSVMCDKERIPIIYDGENGVPGESAVVAYASPDKISAPCNPEDSSGNAYVTSQVSVDVTLSLKVGNTAISPNGNTTYGTLPSGVTVSKQSNSVYRIIISTSATAKGLAAGIAFTVVGTDSNNKSYSAPVTVGLSGAVKGAQGASITGKTGRFLWYAGMMSEIGGSYFTADDYQAPYVNVGDENTPQCYAYVGDNITTTFPSSVSGYTEANGWKRMTTEYEYLIAKAIFAGDAHLGSFIINKDWLLSQYGTLVDSSGTETAVNASNVNTIYSRSGSIILSGNNTNNALVICKVSFKATSNTTVTVTLTPSSESGWDFGAIGKLNTAGLANATASTIKGGTAPDLLEKASGTTAVSRQVTVTGSSQEQFFYIAYAKDGSTNSGSDNCTFSFSGITVTNVTEVKIANGASFSGPRSGVPYTWFDSTDPMASTTPSSGYKFRPNFAVDGLTGKTYQNDAYISGTFSSLDETVNVFSENTGYAARRGIEIKTDKDRQASALLVSDEYTDTVGGRLEMRYVDTNNDSTSNKTVLTPTSLNISNGESDTRVSLSNIGGHGGRLDLYSNNDGKHVSINGRDGSIDCNSLSGNDYQPVAFPANLKTSSFTLPASPTDGMIIFCKGISAALTVTTKSHAIMSRNSNNNWCEANSSATIADRDSVILVFSSAASKWLYFSCD